MNTPLTNLILAGYTIKFYRSEPFIKDLPAKTINCHLQKKDLWWFWKDKGFYGWGDTVELAIDKCLENMQKKMEE